MRAFLLLVLLAAAAFAFVSRATEYMLVEGELTRIENTYRAIGMLAPLGSDNFTQDHDVRAAAESLRPYVAMSDERVFVHGEMQMPDVRNSAMMLAGSIGAFFTPSLWGLPIDAQCQIFYGILRREPALVFFNGQPTLLLHIYVEEMIQGDPRALQVGDAHFVNEQGQTATIRGSRDFLLRITHEEAQLFNSGEFNPVENMRIGGRYVFRASAAYIEHMRGLAVWYLRAVHGVDGLRFTPIYEDGHYWMRLVPDEAVRDMPIFFTQDSAAVREAHTQTFERLEINSRAVNVIGTRDMTAMPRFSNPMHSRILDTRLFPGGRWLTHEDYAYARPVAMLPAQLAIRNGLQVGDTLTVTLRATERPTWIDDPEGTPWPSGREAWWYSYPQGWWALLETAETNTYKTLELEIVGAFWFTPPGMFIHNYTASEIYIPASLIPDGFEWAGTPLLASMYSFVLDSPRSQEPFISAHSQRLREMGFALTFLPTRFDQLVQSTDPIRASITMNLLIFTAVSILILALVVFLYIRSWRKNIAIARALGVSSRRVITGLFAPVIFTWVPAMFIGAFGGWYFARLEAAETLHEVAEYGVAVSVEPIAFILMAAGVILLAIVSVGIGAADRLRRPVLEQLQGSGGRRKIAKRIDSGVVQEDFTVGDLSTLSVVLKKSKSHARLASLRHSMRHILRAPVKTLLAVVLAGLFVFSLNWLNHTILFTETEIERLWRETRIEAELIHIPDEDTRRLNWPALINPNTWDEFIATGFVTDAYVEVLGVHGSGMLLGISCLDGFIAENTKTSIDIALGMLEEDIQVTLIDSFEPEDFVFTPGEPIPVLVSEFFMERDGHSIGDIFYLYIDYFRSQGMFVTSISIQEPARIVGVYDYGLTRGVWRAGRPVVMPLEGLWHMKRDGMPSVVAGITEPTLMTARFTANPLRNREIHQLQNAAERIAYANMIGPAHIPLVFVLDDEVLTNIIAPMEQSLRLFRILYPVALASAFVLAFGLALLTLLQSAKNAAIMRVLGKKKSATCISLIAEQMFVCVFGAGVGLLVLPLAGIAPGLISLALAGIYLAGAFAGSWIGSIVITARPPLELLQIRE